MIYWILSYAAAVENVAEEWTTGVLLNPRLNLMLELPFVELIRVIGAGRSKVELFELFSAAVGDRAAQAPV
jgi:hypothetical protein